MFIFFNHNCGVFCPYSFSAPLSCFHCSSLQPLCLVITPLLFFLSFLCCFSLFSFLLVITLSSLLLSDLSDIEFRVGPGQRRNQEDAERCATRRERESGPGQIQNAAPDPTGQHEAAHRRVRVHVKTAPPSLRPPYPQEGYPLPNFPLSGCLIFHGQQMLPSS